MEGLRVMQLGASEWQTFRLVFLMGEELSDFFRSSRLTGWKIAVDLREEDFEEKAPLDWRAIAVVTCLSFFVVEFMIFLTFSLKVKDLSLCKRDFFEEIIKNVIFEQQKQILFSCFKGKVKCLEKRHILWDRFLKNYFVDMECEESTNLTHFFMNFLAKITEKTVLEVRFRSENWK